MYLKHTAASTALLSHTCKNNFQYIYGFKPIYYKLHSSKFYIFKVKSYQFYHQLQMNIGPLFILKHYFVYVFENKYHKWGYFCNNFNEEKTLKKKFTSI